jgi:hypothetical protein
MASSKHQLRDYFDLIILRVTSSAMLLFRFIKQISSARVIRRSLDYLLDYLVH